MKLKINRRDYSFLMIATNIYNQAIITLVFDDQSSLFGIVLPEYWSVEFAGGTLGGFDCSEWSYNGENTQDDQDELEKLFSYCDEIHIDPVLKG